MRGRFEQRIWPAHPELSQAPPRLRRACNYEVFLPEPLKGTSFPLPDGLATVVTEAEVAIAHLNRSGPYLAPLARLLLRTESIASSRVENLQVDAKHLARAEVRQETGQKASVEALEILANVDAVQFAVEDTAGAQRITPYEILDVHRVLMKTRDPKIAGRLREVQNWIGGNDFNPCGADFVPPPPELVDDLLRDLCRFGGKDDVPTLVQAAVLHAQFETIHPFEDGNGRTGRALLQVVFRRRGLAPSFVPPVSVVLAREKDRYVSGLTAYREGDVLDWIEVFSLAVAEASRLAETYLGRIREMQERWRAQLREKVRPRSDAAAWTVIDVLPAHPVITLPVGVAATGMSKPSVNAAIPQLVEAGVLRPLSDTKRNRAWEASELLDLIVDLENGVG